MSQSGGHTLPIYTKAYRSSYICTSAAVRCTAYSGCGAESTRADLRCVRMRLFPPRERRATSRRIVSSRVVKKLDFTGISASPRILTTECLLARGSSANCIRKIWRRGKIRGFRVSLELPDHHGDLNRSKEGCTRADYIRIRDVACDSACTVRKPYIEASEWSAKSQRMKTAFLLPAS